VILEEETYEKFGYYPSELSKGSNKRILVKCDRCGGIRENYYYQYRDLCRQCKHISDEKRRITSGKNHYNWKGGEVTRICKNCGREFKVAPSKIRKGGGNFCSKACVRKRQKCPAHHTIPELIFEDICTKYNLPFKYTGDGTFWIGNSPSFNPDFIHTNKKRKVCVEVLGAYWHNSILNQNIPYGRTYNGRKALLKERGWEMIGIWDHDLLRKDTEEFVLHELKKYIIVEKDKIK
jgi:G:T-mismatch repair DNA endonuclease (very short patch repair protein)